MPAADRSADIDFSLVKREWPPLADGSLYLNTGSCGRKPQRVLDAISDGWQQLNLNPTRFTFFCDEMLEDVRASLAAVIGGDARNILLTQNTTQGLQMVLQSFLLEPGDELITTTHEHGSLRTIARYLEETRGVVVRRLDIDPHEGSGAFCDKLLNLVTPRTRLVQVSEIDCYTGWRPNLSKLSAELDRQEVPLLVDGAHSPAQGPSSAGSYPLWVASCHKWLGAPNGTGVLYANERWIPFLKPCWLGDRFYTEFENPLRRFEFPGTWDVVRWLGVKAACELTLELGLERIAAREYELVRYLRNRLGDLPGAKFRTPSLAESSTDVGLTFTEASALLTVYWQRERLRVSDIRDFLWTQHKIWVQPDFIGEPGHGMRISCHVSVQEDDIDRLITAMKDAVIE